MTTTRLEATQLARYLERRIYDGVNVTSLHCDRVGNTQEWVVVIQATEDAIPIPSPPEHLSHVRIFYKKRPKPQVSWRYNDYSSNIRYTFSSNYDDGYDEDAPW